MARSQEALDRFERQTAVPMMILALAIIPLLVIPLVFQLTPSVETTFFALDWFIWAAFVVEYGVRLYLAPSKRHFVSHNIIDLVFVLIPFLRPLRIVRSARAFSVLRAARGTVILLRAIKAVQDVLRRHKLGYTLLIAMVVIVGSGLLVAELEQADPERNIRSIPDALWWAITTVTTVGYGDRFPVTAIGRAVGAVVMVIGIGLFGLLAASLASFMIEKDIEKGLDPQMVQIEERLSRIETLLENLKRRQAEDRSASTGDGVDESDGGRVGGVQVRYFVVSAAVMLLLAGCSGSSSGSDGDKDALIERTCEIFYDISSDAANNLDTLAETRARFKDLLDGYGQAAPPKIKSALEDIVSALTVGDTDALETGVTRMDSACS